MLDSLLAARFTPQGEAALLASIDQIPDAGHLVRILLGQDEDQQVPEDIFQTNLLLAGRLCVRGGEKVPEELRDEVAARLFKRVQSPYTEVRQALAAVLMKLGGMNDQLLARLLSLMAHPDEPSATRVSLLDALGELCIPHTARAVLAVWLQARTARTWDIAEHAVEALKSLRDVEVLPDLLDLLQQPRQEDDEGDGAWLRMEAVGILGSLADAAVVPQLVAMLDDEQEDVFVRCSVVWALLNTGEHAVASHFLGLLQRRLAMGRTSAQGDRLSEALIYGIGTLGDVTMISPLISWLFSPLDSDLHDAMVWAICHLAEPAAYATLLMPLLTRKEIELPVRRALALTLAMAGDAPLLDRWRHLTDSEGVEPELRLITLLARGRCSDEAVKPELARIFREEPQAFNPLIWSSVLDCIDSQTRLDRLGPHGWPSLDVSSEIALRVAIARSFVTAPASERKTIVAALSQFALIRSLIAEVRIAIIDTLGELANKIETIQLLLPLLRETNTEFIDHLRTALRKICRRTGVTILALNWGATYEILHAPEDSGWQ